MKREFNDDEFKVSSLCVSCKHCVSVAFGEDGIAVRDTKDPHKSTLQFSKQEWQAFIAGVKRGEFDI